MATVKPVIQYDLNHDVHITQVMASSLVPFVYENETYGGMPDDLPKLTIGGLLMRLNRLPLLGTLLSDEQREKLNTAQQQLENVKREWLTAYTHKITHELSLHINEWTQFLNECVQDQEECRDIYPSIAEKRVMAQNLADEARKLKVLTPEMDKRLREIDLQVQAYFKPGNFIWDQRLQTAYPQDHYVFLYVSI